MNIRQSDEIPAGLTALKNQYLSSSLCIAGAQGWKPGEIFILDLINNKIIIFLIFKMLPQIPNKIIFSLHLSEIF